MIYSLQRARERYLLDSAVLEGSKVLTRLAILVVFEHLQAIVQHDSPQTFAAVKRPIANFCQSLRGDEFLKTAAVEAPATDLLELAAILKCDFLQPLAAGKREIS